MVEQDVSAGQLIQPGTTQCFMISDVSTVWVLVNVYQKDLPYVRSGDQVTIQTDTYPEVFHGRIAYVAASLDPSTRTLQARIETNNPGEKLKKDMYVVATVNAGTIQNAIALPDAAVLRDSENQPFVYARGVPEPVWQTLGDSRRKLEWKNGDYQRPESRRSRHRGWQFVPAVCELAAALTESGGFDRRSNNSEIVFTTTE